MLTYPPVLTGTCYDKTAGMMMCVRVPTILCVIMCTPTTCVRMEQLFASGLRTQQQQQQEYASGVWGFCGVDVGTAVTR